MEYIRKQFYTLKERLLEPRKFMQVLAGPRQVGKSTLVDQVLAQVTIPHTIEVADAVDPKDSDWIHRVWESARATMMLRKLYEYLLVIDEVQKIENWSEVVKREWDADSRGHVNLKVVLLGSSRLLLKKGLTESLAGRFELIRMPHWSLQEMRDAFGVSLDEYVYFGGYPGANVEPYIDYLVKQAYSAQGAGVGGPGWCPAEKMVYCEQYEQSSGEGPNYLNGGYPTNMTNPDGEKMYMLERYARYSSEATEGQGGGFGAYYIDNDYDNGVTALQNKGYKDCNYESYGFLRRAIQIINPHK